LLISRVLKGFYLEMFPGLTLYWKEPNATHITFAVRGVGNGGFVAVGFPAGICPSLVLIPVQTNQLFLFERDCVMAFDVPFGKS
jgi:hypothetical protein